jgi:hypothetical protein
VIRLAHRIHHDESGLSGLEKLGIAAIIISFLAFIPAARGLLGDIYTKLFKSVDESGATTAFSIAARGILVAATSVLAFVGSGYMLIYTNLGKRLGMLVTGAALFGWLTIGSVLFVVYAPRGLRPSSVEGLGSIAIRIPAIGLTVSSLILFVMFVVALDKYEKESDI